MSTINDATVVASAYDTIGNGGRKLIRLSNGWFISVVKSSTTYYLYKSTDNFATTPTLLYSYATSVINDMCIVELPNNVIGVLMTANNSAMNLRRINAVDGTELQVVSPDSGQNAMGNISAIVNDAKTELHATWTSTSTTYPSSSNIRYAKGTIAVNGTVTWGVVEQVTTVNSSGTDLKNPTIVLHSIGLPVLLFEEVSSSYNEIRYLVRKTDNTGWQYDGYNGGKTLYAGATYTQSSPSAIFVPQSINGLANGRIWVAWHGTASNSSGYNDIYVSYSDDGGVNWIAPTRLTDNGSIHDYFPTITASKDNKIHLVFSRSSGTPPYPSSLVKFMWNATWGTETVVKSLTDNTVGYPSALYDPTLVVTAPLFIYKDSARVGFYGTWIVTTISVTQGSIGAKPDRANVLTYTITTDGTMSTITEKVNGVTVGTKTATSGQSLIAGLTQAQWDAVRFGKYATNDNNLSLVSTDWEQGTHNSTVGNPIGFGVATTVIRQKLPVTVQANTLYSITVPSAYKAYVTETDPSDVVKATSGSFKTGTNSFTTNSATSKVYVAITRVDGAVMNVNEVPTINPTLRKDFANNTLTVEMGTDKWTYTFDKRLATDADIASAIKLAQDSQDTYLPAVKSKLASAIRGKGGTVNDTDAWDTIKASVDGIALGKKWATGTTTSNGSYDVVVTGLAFKPSVVVVHKADDATTYNQISIFVDNIYISNKVLARTDSSTTACTTTSNGFTIGTAYASTAPFNWVAFE